MLRVYVGSTLRNIGSLERGDQEAGFVVVLRLAKALGMTPGELLDGIEVEVGMMARSGPTVMA